MIRRTRYEYEIKHTGDEMDRAEIMAAFGHLAKMLEQTDQAGVEVISLKRDVISVVIETVWSP
ncbi:hypothetical protein [Sulfitobacter sp. 20_GPM-1509m]|uniref:hypothetical protein n=1 Tax=Sulfitobacter sp. 20_GPM-1509m TaxID=1380367 RepID=UPI0012DC4C14|nr:hypothetical protein [Sulfitobacter sp. 20_GPM-1509m]